jgi:hypothetical protein
LRRPAAWSLALSLVAHALVAFFVLRVPSERTPHSAPDSVEVDVRLVESTAPPAPAAEVARPSRPPRETPGAKPDRASRSAPATPGITRRAPPAPAAAASRNPSLLRMRSLADSRPLGQAPPGVEPGEVPRPSGLPFLPPPDVIHHPLTPQVQGGRTTSSGLGVKVDSDGAISFRDPKFVQDVKPGLGGLPGMVGAGGRFDINDLAERAAGNDPYGYEKGKIAEATFEERLCLAEQAALKRKREGLFHLKDRLERLLQLPGLTAARRREIVFEWWDECVDDTADGQPNLGAAARATILVFIRRVFPPEGPDAYTPAELAALNGRRISRGAFDPYGTGRTPDAGAR